MFCSSCGSALVPGAMHCGICGAGTGVSSTVQNSSSQSQGYGQEAQSPFQTDYQQNQGYQNPQQSTYGMTTSGKAIASLVLSLLGISLLGVIFGHIARGEIRRAQGRVQGDGMALAGLIIGWLGIAAWLLFWILVFVAASMSDNYYY